MIRSPDTGVDDVQAEDGKACNTAAPTGFGVGTLRTFLMASRDVPQSIVGTRRCRLESRKV